MEKFDNGIICNNPDLGQLGVQITLLDLYFWGYIKNKLYSFEPPEDTHILLEI